MLSVVFSMLLLPLPNQQAQKPLNDVVVPLYTAGKSILRGGLGATLGQRGQKPRDTSSATPACSRMRDTCRSDFLSSVVGSRQENLRSSIGTL